MASFTPFTAVTCANCYVNVGQHVGDDEGDGHPGPQLHQEQRVPGGPAHGTRSCDRPERLQPIRLHERKAEVHQVRQK